MAAMDGIDSIEYSSQLVPDDRLALQVMATINLCDCVEGWSKNIEEQQAIW